MRLYRETEQEKFYYGDCLRIITKNTAMIAGKGEYVKVSLQSLKRPAKSADLRTPEEIAYDTIRDAGLEVAE